MCDNQYEMLISLVRGYPHLYDKSNQNYKDTRIKDNSWQQISEDLGMNVKDCQRIWLNLRNKFGREKKALSSGSGALTSQWEYMESMSFLSTIIKPRNTHTTTPTLKNVESTKITNFCAPPFQSFILIDPLSDCSNTRSNSSILENSLLSPQSNKKNLPQEEFRQEENVCIKLEESQEWAPTANSETVQITSLGNSENKKNVDETVDACKEIVDAAKSITLHLKNLTEKQQEPKTSADILGEYIASVLKEMTPEKQKIKRRRLLEVLESDE